MQIPVPAEPSIAFDDSKEPIYKASEDLAKYLWSYWGAALSQRAIFVNNLHVFMMAYKRNEIISWHEGKTSWTELVDNVAQSLFSATILYQFTFKLKPESPFGLPQEGVTIVPSTVSEYTSAVIDNWIGKPVGWGTMSRYRDEKEKINVARSVRGIKAALNDNFIYISVQSADSDSAYKDAANFVEHFVYFLTLFHGVNESAKQYSSTTKFEYEVVGGSDQYGRRVPIMHTIDSWTFTSYDLKSLKEQLSLSINSEPLISDAMLRKSLEYFYHAIHLNSIRVAIQSDTMVDHLYFTSDMIMNLQKAVTVIVGDKTKGDDYKNIYKHYGIDYDFWSEKIEGLKKLRNNWDVAHYELTKEKLQTLDGKVGEAIDVTRRVILKYVEHLKTTPHS